MHNRLIDNESGESAEDALPLTQAQLGVWLSQQTGHTDTDWQLSQFVIIDGAIEPDLVAQAIREVVREAEPLRATIFEVDGRVFQRAIDHPDIEVPFYDLRRAQDPVAQAHDLASSIQRTPMSWAGPLFRFALFATGPDQFLLFICIHHIVLDGFGFSLLANRIATVYSALARDAPVPAACFGSLHHLVDYESEYEASSQYCDDLTYWKANLSPANGPDYRWTQSRDGRDSCSASVPIRLDPCIIGRVGGLARTLGVRRTSVLAAACALLVRNWCRGGSEVVLDFPVSRRTSAQSKTLPAMVAGVVPLVLRASPGSTVADFCEHVDARIREVLRHQRFPVHVLQHSGELRVAQRAVGRVSVNFLPSTSIRAFDGAGASAQYTTLGHVDHFGLFFVRDGEQIFLSTAGAGQPFSDFDQSDLAVRLLKMLAAMTADPGRSLSSMNLVDEDELRDLAQWGNRAALTRTNSAEAV
ncbi:non-ribosomal peptide synthetase, partial [Mycobacterium simiae]